MKRNDFKIGDKVKIDWRGNKSHGKIGMIVKNYEYDKDLWIIKIPDFNGHFGLIEDGTKDKWHVHFSNLTKIKQTKKKGNSMKIELKKTEPKAKEITYPCFRKSTNGNELIVLFFGPKTGVVVDPGTSPFKSGNWSNTWGTFSETPLEGHSATFSSEP